MFWLVMLPPQIPHPRLDVIGMPLVNEPALAFDCGCLTIIRLTGATRARASMCCVVVGEDAARVALAGDLVDPAHLVEGVVEPVVAVDGQERGQLLTGERGAPVRSQSCSTITNVRSSGT